MAVLKLVKIVLLGIFLSSSLPAYADSSEDAEIESLMGIFRVREVLQYATTEQRNSQDMQQLPESVRNCIFKELSPERMYEETKFLYKQVFSNPEMRSDVIAFFESETGTKFIDGLFTGKFSDVAGEDPFQSLSSKEKDDINQFFMSPSGTLFIDIQPRLKELLSQSVQKLVPTVVRECCPPSKS